MTNYKYFIKKIKDYPGDITVLEIGPQNGQPVFHFKPGQYVMISYKNESGRMEDKHPFSIASSPLQKDYIRLGIKVIGNFTQGISKLKEGDEIIVSRPFGDFIFDEDKYKNLVLFAGGIGITPFMSILDYAHRAKLANNFSLLYSNKTLDKTLFLEEIKKLEEKNKNIKTLFSVTEEKIPADTEVEGVITERINKDVIRNFCGSLENKSFFVCGPVPFMNAIKTNLLGLGVDKSQIEMEEFSMIPDAGFLAKVKNVFYTLSLSAAMMFMPFYLIYTSDKKLFDISTATADNQATKVQAQDEVAKEEENQTEISAVSSDKKSEDKKSENSSSKTAAPKPITSASIVAEFTPVLSKSAYVNSTSTNTPISSNSSNRPAPVTSASSPAPVATRVQTQTQQSSASVSASPSASPSPTTSASSVSTAPVSSSPATVVTNVTSNSIQPVVSTSQPAPVTSGSTVASTGSVSSGTSVSSATITAPAPAPAPVTSASTPLPSSGTTITNPTTQTQTQTQTNSYSRYSEREREGYDD